MLQDATALEPIYEISTKQDVSKRARKRNRRRAKDLSAQKLREIKRDFDVQRNTLEVGQNHLLPRSEAVDGVLIRLSDEVRSVRDELSTLRRQMGIADRSGGRPFLIARTA
ncbi:MAG: hypothetical protein KGL39_20450 [Patescibacteria group bacterium]|nr:hypothetical protein [Patescibacteria group bacterium]